MVEYLGDGNPSGTVLGRTASELVAFYGGTPAAQRSEAAMGALTLTTATNSAFGFVSSAAFDAFVDQLGEIRATLVALGLHSGAA